MKTSEKDTRTAPPPNAPRPKPPGKPISHHLCEQCKKEQGEYVVIDYERAMLLCKSCLYEYEHMFGEINTESFHIKIGIYAFIQRVNEILKYLDEMQTRYSDRYFAAKKLAEEYDKEGIDISPDVLLAAIKW